jgi:glycerol-3-phosphate dehydrogenase
MPTYKRTLETEVLVIGGGSTGTGVARDAAMRGFRTVLVERFGISDGTTRRYHGLLHSGGRYVVNDPEAARECIQENRILRRIMPHGLDDTGGFFVLAPGDDPAFISRFLEAAKACGLPVDEVPAAQMLKEEPALNPRISHCFWVSDAVGYGYVATSVTARSAADYGATVLPHHGVEELICDGRRVLGAVCRDEKGELVRIMADVVVSASGPLAGKVAEMAGIRLPLVPGKGTMVAVDHIPLRTVINRCRYPTDGDIIVPKRGEAIVGTTDIEIKDPDQYGVTGAEIAQMLQAGEEVLPGFGVSPTLRAWAGVRPLFPAAGGDITDPRGVSRTHALLDHAGRDGIDNFVTITGGKWTTHRLMAEQTVDLVCQKLGVDRPCRTHLESLTEEMFEPEK